MEGMVDPQTFARQVETYVRPQSFPLAIRMLSPGESLPPRTKQPKRDWNLQIATCQAISMARRYGWTIAVGREDLNCVLTKVIFGLEKEVPYYTEGHCACGMYTETLEAGAKSEAATDRFAYGSYERILVGPASTARFEPHVYLIYANAAQVMRMVTAALYKRGGAITSHFTGRLDCSDEIIRTMNTQDYQVILPCYGDRVFGQTEDHEMAFSLPAPLAEEFIEGLKGTHQGGIRYPIPAFLRYTGQFPPSYQRLEEIWREQSDERTDESHANNEGLHSER
ncbi:MAG: hypothetical protein D6723_06490 [Acidobacteria bacterium]|nr:MAG: hypothetical protein D6723_06490 [Acidobacteriota bacterium]